MLEFFDAGAAFLLWLLLEENAQFGRFHIRAVDILVCIMAIFRNQEIAKL